MSTVKWSEYSQYKKYEGKTVAYEGEHYTLSGWSENISQKAKQEFNIKDKLVNKTMENMADLSEWGYYSKESWMDHGEPYRYNASHAEKQVSMYEDSYNIGVSRDMCDDCQNFFTAKAQLENKEYVVADTSTIHIFTTGGVQIQIDRSQGSVNIIRQ